MKQTVILTLFFLSATIVAQNNDNTENRSKNAVTDSLMNNTYHLKVNQNKETFDPSDPLPSGLSEPVSKTNRFQDPTDESTTWKDYERDALGNIVYGDGLENNGKVKWQDASYWSSREKQGVWEAAKLPYVSEDDVIWGTRVIRDIDLREPANIPLYYPIQTVYRNHYTTADGALTTHTNNEIFSGIDARKNLFQILFDAAWAGQVNVYNFRMSRQYSEQEIKGDIEKGNGVLRYLDKVPPPDTTQDSEDFDDEAYREEDDEEVEGISAMTRYLPQDIVKYRIVEDWFFDKRRAKMDVRIISITPLVEANFEIDNSELDLDELGISGTNYTMVGTFFYPEVRQLLANHKIYNEQNMMARMSFDEYFQRRLFNSSINKESNVYDRKIDNYINKKNKLAQLLEAERIKENIRKYEHNAWEY